MTTVLRRRTNRWPLQHLGTPTAGSWPGVVGSNGYVLCGWNGAAVGAVAVPATNVTSLPTGVSLGQVGQSGWCYVKAGPVSGQTATALRSADGTQAAQALYFSSTSFTVTFTWDGSHSFRGVISIYVCDYTSSARAQTISDGTRTISQANPALLAGAWAQFNETIAPSGSVTFTFTKTNFQTDASGFFFDNGYVV